jgi:hypothetical protein
MLPLRSVAWRRSITRHARLLSVAGTPGRPEGVSAAASVSSMSEVKPGLFQLPDLHVPSDFVRLTRDVKLQCHQLRQEVQSQRARALPIATH